MMGAHRGAALASKHSTLHLVLGQQGRNRYLGSLMKELKPEGRCSVML